MFTAETIAEIGRIANEFGMEAAALLAIAEVESGGTAFALVRGRREPLIRFEGHYFDRRLDVNRRAIARKMGLASPVAGAVANPPSQARRWSMLEQAMSIDAKAACESVSWGIGQVMGAHWQWLGYMSIEEMVAQARSGIAGQARLMAQYIEKAGLAPALRDHDWEAFARGYNGPGYRKNAYHKKLAAAYARHAGRPITMPVVLRLGSRGEAVRALQRDLGAAGYALAADSVYGPATAAAVRRFQMDHGLAVDGIAGPRTLAALAEALAPQAAPVRLMQRLFDRLRFLFGRP